MVSALQPGISPQNASSVDDFYVPAYRVSLKGKGQPINGKPQAYIAPDIVSVTFHDSLTDVDSVDLVVNNWDPGKQVNNTAVQGKFRYHNTNLFDPWQDIEVSMGYYRQGQDQLMPMLVGQIASMAPSFPASGGSTLAVRALSLLHRFRIKQKTLQFLPTKTDSEIADQIVKDINADAQKKLPKINIQIPPEEVAANKANEAPVGYLEMHNQYPIVFLMQRSRDIGYDITIEDSVDDNTGIRNVLLHYRSSASVLRPTYALQWGKSLISFQPTLQTARQVNSVTVKGWNVQTKKPISETATRADLAKADQKTIAPEDLGLDSSQASDTVEIVVDRGFKNPKEAKNVALKTLRQLAQGLVTAKGKTIGLPELRAGSKVNIYIAPLDLDSTGQNPPPPLTDRFSGVYQVTETTHTISDSGYTTDFSCRMEARISK
jgi:phage protein D